MTDVIEVDKYEPDYNHRCEVCDADHVVTGVKDGKVVYQGSMCGVCTWGEVQMINPEKWNE